MRALPMHGCKRVPTSSQHPLLGEALQHTDLLKVGDHPPHLQALRSAAHQHLLLIWDRPASTFGSGSV